MDFVKKCLRSYDPAPSNYPPYRNATVPYHPKFVERGKVPVLTHPS